MKIGKRVSISWGNGNSADLVTVQVSRDNGVTWTDVIVSQASSGSYEWVVTGPACAQARLKIFDITYPLICSISQTFAIESIPVAASNSVRTNLRNALKACLLEITTAELYENTIKRAYDPPVAIEKMEEFPCVNLILSDEVVETDRLVGNDALYDIRLPVAFDFFLYSVNNTNLSIDSILKDVQKYFGRNYYIQQLGAERSAFNCKYTGSTVFGTDSNKPNCGIQIRFDIWYSIQVNNPTAMV